MELKIFYRQTIPLMVATVVLWIFEAVGLKQYQEYIFWVFFLVMLGVAYKFLSGAIGQISDHLNIYCFSIQK